jgi:hypothetical protein
MEHFYDNVEIFEDNWFTYPGLYQVFSETLQNGNHFVEVGAWKGQSISYLAVELINQNKTEVQVDVIDNWLGTPVEHDDDIWVKNNQLYEKFLQNTATVSHMINPIRKNSLEASQDYEDNSLDIVFIDAAHDYENVYNDLKAWFPKVKSTGIISGHDWKIVPDVTRAVIKFFGIMNIMSVSGQCWLVYKEKYKPYDNSNEQVL